jgi:hypothetical protein
MELEQRRRKVRKRGGVLTALQRDLPLQGITMAQDLGDAVLQVGDLLLAVSWKRVRVAVRCSSTVEW